MAGRRLALYLRAEKICTVPKSKFKNRMKNLPDESVQATPEVLDFSTRCKLNLRWNLEQHFTHIICCFCVLQVCIEGTVLSDNMPGMRYKFIMADPDGDEDKLTFCGVEELVLEHYKNNGYPEGKAEDL